MKHLELFAGIGGFRRAMDLLTKDDVMDFESVGFSEIDKRMLLTYKTVYEPSPNEVEMGDIVEFTKNKENIENLPNFDLLTGGFPCQSYSIFGKLKGLADPRGQMFYRIMDVLEVKHPRYVLLENVRNLLTHDHGNTFNVIKSELERIGYHVYYSIFNTVDFHLPQIRRRILIFCTLDNAPVIFDSEIIQSHFDWIYESASVEKANTVLDILDKNVDSKYFLSEKMRKLILSCGTKGFKTWKPTINTPIAKPLKATMHKGQRASEGNYYTQEWIDTNGVINAQDVMTMDELALQPIRKLTPEETFLLQGFPKEFAAKARENGVSNTALYMQAGNAVSVNVIYAALRWLIEMNYIKEV